MFRRKKSEASRVNWLFCSRSCSTISSNEKRKRLPINKTCRNCEGNFLLRASRTIFCSKSCKTSFSNKINNPMNQEKARLKISGPNNYNWQGGITPEQKKIRNSKAMITWRETIFKRDNYTCQECGSRGVTLNADHIKPLALYPELCFSLKNGRTLCVTRHLT